MQARQVRSDRFAQFDDAKIVRVEGFAARKRGGRLFANERRRNFIRLAEPEWQHRRIIDARVRYLADLRCNKRADGGASGRRGRCGGGHRSNKPESAPYTARGRVPTSVSRSRHGGSSRDDACTPHGFGSRCSVESDKIKRQSQSVASHPFTENT